MGRQKKFLSNFSFEFFLNRKMWLPILNIQSCAPKKNFFTDADVEEQGFILNWPNLFSSNVEVEIRMFGTVRTIHMPWVDRPENFQLFLEECRSVFRLSVNIRCEVIQSYTLWVDSEAFENEMKEKGAIRGELHAIMLFKHFLNCSQLPRSSNQESTNLVSRNYDTFKEWNGYFPLYEYQWRSIQWMRSIERKVSTGENHLSFGSSIPVTQEWFFDALRDMFCKTSTALKENVRGGILCDDMGTGKTACAIALSLQVDYDFELPSDQLVSNATLVLVPLSLPHQWVQEIEKFAPNANLICLTNSKDVKHISLFSMLQADFVIVTSNFVKNKTMSDSLDELLTKKFGKSVDRRGESKASSLRLLSRFLRFHASNEELRSIPPFCEVIFWKRMIVDEIHELTQATSSGKDRMRVARSIQSKTSWGLTATPNTACEAIQSMFPFVIDSHACEPEYHSHVCLLSSVRDSLFRRFASSDLEAQHKIFFVKLSAKERALLVDEPLLEIEKAVRLCSEGGRIKNDREAVALLLEERRREMSDMESQLITLEQQLIKQFLGSKSIEKLSFSLSQAENKFNQLRRLFEFSNTRLKHAFENEESCPICMDASAKSMLTCGHSICFVCYKKIMSTTKMCSICRTPISQVFETSPDQNQSSKALGAATLIRGLLEEGKKILVFSQFKSLVQEVMQFENISIRGALLEGTSQRRANTIKKFKENTIKILFILLERNGTGTGGGLDLSEANAVVFLHAIVGEMQNALPMEQQAISRASRCGQTDNVLVYHVLAKDSPEESFWLSRHQS